MCPDGTWASLFFQGKRLEAEVVLHAQRFNGDLSSEVEFESRLQQQQRALGRALPNLEAPVPALQAAYQDAGESAEALKALIQKEPGYPDPLLLWTLRSVLPAAANYGQRCASAAARQLAKRVRASELCDTKAMPEIFSQQLAAMLKSAA